MKAVLVPVKAFHDAKLRLSSVLPARERAALARSLAEGVILAAAPTPVTVVCDDHEVAAFAEALGASVVWTPGLGLSGAVDAGVAELALGGVTRVVVAHADIPRPAGIALVGDVPAGTPAAGAGPDVVVLVPDLRSDGTNVMVLPTGSGFRTSYGPGSFERHRDEATRVGLAVVVIEHPDLGRDIDLPEDLADVALSRP